MKKCFFFSLLTLFVFNSFAQSAYHHISDSNLYLFIDELASKHVIDLSTAVKPYTRKQIANYLLRAHEERASLSSVQKARLDLYMQEFVLENGLQIERQGQLIDNPPAISVHLLPPEIIARDSLFATMVRPIYGFRNFSGGNDNFWVNYGGAEAISYVGNNWSVYASLRDNYQKGQRLSQPTYLTREFGGNYKGITGGGTGGEFSEMRGGITWDWSWGTLGLIKDHLEWGDNQNGSNIFSGRTPSFPMIKLFMNPTTWLEFNYYHGWLTSQAVDSTNIHFSETGRPRTVQRQKYIAANMFTVKPFSRLHISVGNSIVYGDTDIHPGYLIPFFFYKSVVHSTHWGTSFQNNAMYLNISSRQIKHLHVYASYFVDEFSIRRIGDPNRFNFSGGKGGVSLTDWPLPNTTIGFEYTRTNPITYLHDEPTTTFASNLYNLGHYLKDNAEEFYLEIRYYPWRTLQLSASYVNARKGNYYEYERYRREPRLDELPPLQETIWQKSSLSLAADYQPLPNLRVFASFSMNNIQGFDLDERSAQDYLDMFTAPYLHGKTNVLEVGFGYGFN